MAFYDIILRNNHTLLKKKWLIIAGIGIVAVGIIAYLVWPKASSYTYHKVEGMTLKRTITVSGSVKAPEEVNLAFKSSGRIEDIAVKAGDFVKAGDYLMKLETREAENAIAQARASLYEASARLNQLQAGITDEERSLLQSRVDSARKNLSDVKQTTTYQIRASERAVESAQTAYDNAVKNYTEGKTFSGQIASQTLSGGVLTARSAVSSIDSLLEQTDLIMGLTNRYKTYNDAYENLLSSLNLSYKSLVEKGFYSVQADLKNMPAYENDDIAYIEHAKPLLDKAATLADNMVQVLSNTVPSTNLPQETINGWQNNIITLKTNLISSKNSVENVLQQIQNVATSGGTTITGLLSSLSQLENAVNTAKAALDRSKTDLALARSQATAQITQAENNLTLAERELSSRSSSPREVDLAIYRAAVSAAQSRLNHTIIQRDDLVLTAPADSVVGKRFFEKGEMVSMGQTVITLIAGEPNEVRVNFPETDIVYISKNKPLTFTFDGFSQNYVYDGTVDSIEPSATEIQGVIYYASDIVFNPNQYEGVQPRPGMTVNISIIADQKDVTMSAPYSAVREDNFGNRQVAIVSDNGTNFTPKLVNVQTGYEGDEHIEILSGIEPGYTILLDVQKYQE